MPEKRAVIFVNGFLPAPGVVKGQLKPGDFLIAADGGLKHLKKFGLQPDLLIGDLDSVEPADLKDLQASGREVLQYPVHKNETDLELALLEAARRGFTVIWLVAALGGRLDQTLANLGLLLLPELSSLDVRLFDGREEVFLIRGVGEIHGEPDDLVSLIPLNGPAAGITTHGLLYALTGESLHPERSRGISNRLLGQQARVEVETGVLLCIQTHQK